MKYVLTFILVFLVLFHIPVLINYVDYNKELSSINENIKYNIGLCTGHQRMPYLKWVDYKLTNGLELRDSYQLIGPIAGYAVHFCQEGNNYLVISDSTQPKRSIICGTYPLDDSKSLAKHIGKKFSWSFYGGLKELSE